MRESTRGNSFREIHMRWRSREFAQQLDAFAALSHQERLSDSTSALMLPLEAVMTFQKRSRSEPSAASSNRRCRRWPGELLQVARNTACR